jgi:ubiquinone/menaquinone biosynthesis C-methylase UbiE
MTQKTGHCERSVAVLRQIAASRVKDDRKKFVQGTAYMKLNWAERWAVNNPARIIEQRLEINAFCRMLPLAHGARILEIGCGRGAGAQLLIEKFKPMLLHLMDLDIEMIVKARRRLAQYDRNRVFSFTGDVLHLPYRDQAFDAVFGFGVLHHVPDWRAGLAEIARVLKPGGCYFYEELYPSLYQNFITKHILLHPTENRFRSEDWKAALRQQNLRVIKTLEQKMLGILGAAVKE